MTKKLKVCHECLKIISDDFNVLSYVSATEKGKCEICGTTTIGWVVWIDGKKQRK